MRLRILNFNKFLSFRYPTFSELTEDLSVIFDIGVECNSQLRASPFDGGYSITDLPDENGFSVYRHSENWEAIWKSASYWSFYDPSGVVGEMWDITSQGETEYPPSEHDWFHVLNDFIVPFLKVPIYCLGT